MGLKFSFTSNGFINIKRREFPLKFSLSHVISFDSYGIGVTYFKRQEMRLRFSFSSDRLIEIGAKFFSNLFASHVLLPVPNTTANAQGRYQR